MTWDSKPPTEEELKSSWMDQPPTEEELALLQDDSTLKKYARAATETIPAIGGMVGGAAGFASPIPGGTLAGSVIGSGLGKAIEKTIKQYGFGEDPGSRQEMVKELGNEMAGAAIAEPVGSLIGKGIQKGAETAGKALYKSGLPRMPEAIKELAYKYKLIGEKSDIAAGLEQIQKPFIDEVNDLAWEATKKGGEVDMAKAMQPAIARIREIRLSKDPQLQPLADALESEVGEYLKLNKKPAQEVIKSLPVKSEYIPSFSEVSFSPERNIELPIQGEIIPSYSTFKTRNVESSLPIGGQTVLSRGSLGEEIHPTRFMEAPAIPIKYTETIPGDVIPEKFLQKQPILGFYKETIPGKTIPESFIQNPEVSYIDVIPEQAGPTVSEGIGFKRSLYQTIPKKSWQYNVANPEWAAGQKTLALGMKEATEEATSRALGPREAQRMAEANKAWGDLEESIKYLKRGGPSTSGSLLSPIETVGAISSPQIGIPYYLAKKVAEGNLPQIGLGLSQAAPNMAAQGKAMVQAAIQAGIAPFVIEGFVKKVEGISNTMKAQLRQEAAKAAK